MNVLILFLYLIWVCNLLQLFNRYLKYYLHIFLKLILQKHLFLLILLLQKAML